MIAVTGDFHGQWERFHAKELKKLKKGDTLIICGDFGFVWNNSKEEKRRLKKIGKLKYHVLVLEGSHDNIPLLRTYPLEDWCGGQVRRISGNLLMLQRGNIYSVEGKTFFAFGGGESSDMDQRQMPEEFWQMELPNQEELNLARQNLQAVNYQVDYVVTHQCTSKIQRFIAMESDHINHLTAFFDEIAPKLSIKQWYFGCYHKDTKIPPYYCGLFQNVEGIK